MRGQSRRAVRRTERGSMAVEMVILAPVLMMFVLLVIAFGRYVGAQGEVDATARDAARAASLEVSRGAAASAAAAVAQQSVDSGATCSAPRLSGDWVAGGEIQVDMDCQVSYEDLGLIGVRGSTDVSASSAVPLDPFRRYE